MSPIYLDYAATTPCDPQVAAKMAQYLTLDGVFGNPASTAHSIGWQASDAVEQARRAVARCVGAHPREIIWTSGATESNNLALLGSAYFHQRRGKHIITVATEHKAVLDSCQYLASQGFELTVLSTDADGRLSLETLADAIRPETILTSVMLINNETGVIQDIQGIGQLLAKRHIVFHVDAAQAVGKVKIDAQQLPVDLMSFSAHKAYGPKGIGALFVRRKPRARLVPLIYGGGHEQGLRSGTLATHQIVGMGEAFSLIEQHFEQEVAQLSALKTRLCRGLLAIEGAQLNGSATHSSPAIANISFAEVDGEALLMSLTELAVSSGSACNSTNIAPSHVLAAMGLSDELAHSSIRFSLGRFTTEQQVDAAIGQVSEQVNQLRNLSPLWSLKPPREDEQ